MGRHCQYFSARLKTDGFAGIALVNGWIKSVKELKNAGLTMRFNALGDWRA
jgi:hypothetical protein